MRICTALFAIGFASTASAQVFECRYTLECLEAEPCQATDFSVTLTNKGGGDSAVTLQTGTETLRGTGIQIDGPAHTVFPAPTALHFVSAATVGEVIRSRYSVHMVGPIAVTYHGVCEGSQ